MTNIILKSGKTIMPNSGVIGLGLKGQIMDGYDSGFILEGDENYDDGSEYYELTKEEQKEVCDIMLKRWGDLRNSL